MVQEKMNIKAVVGHLDFFYKFCVFFINFVILLTDKN